MSRSLFLSALALLLSGCANSQAIKDNMAFEVDRRPVIASSDEALALLLENGIYADPRGLVVPLSHPAGQGATALRPGESAPMTQTVFYRSFDELLRVTRNPKSKATNYWQLTVPPSGALAEAYAGVSLDVTSSQYEFLRSIYVDAGVAPPDLPQSRSDGVFPAIMALWQARSPQRRARRALVSGEEPK
jgi:hypothetical protein